ncbi:pyrokinin-1 receptor-like [Gigantopelta aegis]|uniref:pyrokinin-1 receptor-like n=1 Tax=Gigantopelta aegis TaxID=1735272 RepID=UPI001B88B01F|nr:pyrokinin-1 receptor-like [Gigantopelta aegis]
MADDTYEETMMSTVMPLNYIHGDLVLNVENYYYDDDDNDSTSVNSSTLNLLRVLGPQRKALSTVIPITIVYCVIFITGIVGNVSTCAVIARKKYMHTATNYYLFNLAVSDLLLLILGLPQETYSFWHLYPYVFGEAFCRFRYLAAEASTNASVLTITAFTIERYAAICHPMQKMPSSSNLKRAVRVICIIWILSVVCAIPISLQFGIIYSYAKSKAITESAQCNTVNEAESKVYFQMSTFLFFVFPMTLISILYFLIALAIKRSGINRNESDLSGENESKEVDLRVKQKAQARQSVLNMLVAVVVAFFVCWAPYHAQRLLVVYVKTWTPNLLKVHDILYYVSGIFYYFSSTINPILYSIMSLKFRQAFRSSLRCQLCTVKQLGTSCSYTYKFSKRISCSDTNVDSASV